MRRMLGDRDQVDPVVLEIPQVVHRLAGEFGDHVRDCVAVADHQHGVGEVVVGDLASLGTDDRRGVFTLDGQDRDLPPLGEGDVAAVARVRANCEL